MIKRFYYWDEWRKAYWEQIDKYPELFVFLHRMYVSQYHTEWSFSEKGVTPHSVEKKNIFIKAYGLLRHRSGSPSLDYSTDEKSQPETEGAPSHVDVLFDAVAARDTCLGVGEKIIDGINNGQSKLTIGFYQNARRIIIPATQHHGCAVFTLKTKLTIKGSLRFIWLLPVVYWFGLKSRPVAKYIFFHPIQIWINLFKITTTAVCLDRLLDHVNPRIILSCNEQGGSDTSLLFALGKKRGIKTIQYLHCPPTKQFVPFICEEYWSWSELATRMLVGEVEDSRVINIGSLEHDSRGFVLEEEPHIFNEERRILFFSQLGLDEAWGIKALSQGVALFKDAVSNMKNVTIRIRLHPNTSKEKLGQIEELYSGLDYELTTKETLLEDDVKWATHVYTVCSNAVFSALRGGKPGYLLWNKELDEIYGRAFLPDENIINDRAGLIESIEKMTSVKSSESILQRIIGSPGAIDRAIERLYQVVDESC